MTVEIIAMQLFQKKALKVDNYWKYPAENMIAGCKNTVIPEDIAGIAEGSFYDLRSLESITVPDKMEGYSSNNANNYRNTNLFPQCNNLKSITWRGKEYKRLRMNLTVHFKIIKILI